MLFINVLQVSRIFDPFMYLSLPLPVQKTRDVLIYLVRADPTSDVVRVGVL